MKLSGHAVAGLLGLLSPVHAIGSSPVGKAIEMISNLQSKVVKEGELDQKLYEEYAEWCEDRAANLGNEIKTGQAEVTTLKATIESESSTIASLMAKIEDLIGGIAVDEADAQAAMQIRAAEAKSFKTAEAELVETTSMLERAIGIIEREMSKGGASMLQLQSAKNIAQALGIMVKAAVLDSADATRLTALLQNSHQSENMDSEEEDAYMGAPKGSVYESQSGNILETLKGLLDDAETQLDDARKKETANQHNFEMLKQSIEDEIKFGNKDLDEAKKGLAASGGAKSAAEGDLFVTSKDLASGLDTKGTLHRDCMTRAEDFEAATKSRNEELKALAAAKKALVEATGGAAGISYGLGQLSFIQTVATATLTSSTDLANFEAVRIVRDLARKVKSAALAQLVQRMTLAMQAGDNGSADPFAKIKGLISNMIEKLEGEADADATEKSYCDKELAETRGKNADKTAEMAKQTTRIDRMSSKSSVLKEEVADLQHALAKLAAAQADMNTMRAKEHAAFLSNKADMEQGLEGVKLALKILNEYYASEDKAHDAAVGSGESIIGLLEVVESDFTKDRAEVVSTEQAAAAAYDRETKDNEIERTTKDKDVEYKSKEAAYLDKETAELSSDRETVQAELDAVLEYLKRLEGRCIAKAESYAERKKRFETELAGLKEALQILESETALLQRRSLRHSRKTPIHRNLHGQ